MPKPRYRIHSAPGLPHAILVRKRLGAARIRTAIGNGTVSQMEIPRHLALVARLKNRGLPLNLWVKKLGLCPRPQDFQGMAPVSKGGNWSQWTSVYV